MVAATPSGGWLQSSPVDPGTRLLPRHARRRCSGSTRASGRARARQAAAHDAVADPGAARRRALPRLGTPGGDQQDQWMPQFFLRHVHAGMNLQEAIDAPAWHTEHFPSSFWPRTSRPGVWWSRAGCPRRRSRSCAGAASRSRSARTGPKGGSRRLRATAAPAGGRRTRAACRATRPEGETETEDTRDCTRREPPSAFLHPFSHIPDA